MSGAGVVRRVVAHNADTASDNRIHDDSVARRHGFRGGLVPGVTVYAYMAHVPAARWGRAWSEHGTMTARFLEPVYDGESVQIVGTPEGGPDASPVMTLRVVGPDGGVRATGGATLLAAPGAGTGPAGTTTAPGTGHGLLDHPERPLPDERPPADEVSLAPGTVLGTVVGRYLSAAAPPFLDQIHEDLDLFSGGALAHPGWLIRFANAAVAANVALGPWIHVDSEATHLGPVTDGTGLRFRSRVDDAYERRGHRYAVLDGMLVAVDDAATAGPDGAAGAGAATGVAGPAERAVMHVRHRVIYRLRG